jgi:DNA repair ATPase RecN
MATTSDNTGRIILVVVGVLVLAALGYFSTKFFTQKKALSENQIEIEQLNTEIVDLEENIKDLEATITDKDLQLDEKDRLLDEKIAELEKMVARVNQYKGQSNASADKIKQLESRIAEMKGTIDGYRGQIESLTKANVALSQKLDSVTSSATQLKDEKTALLQISEEKSQKIELAKPLKAASFKYYKVKNNGKENEELDFKRMGLDEIKICFNILENLVADPGSRVVYLQIVNPDGSVRTNLTENYSGNFTLDGAQKAYSAKADVDYNRTSQEVCMFFKNDEGKQNKYEKGVYNVLAYTDGILIGRSSFEIK